ncbi:MAG TPA: MlaD family protein [Candidatus Sulfotelmatobacter sp.]|jgi:phospholipid/cholesterol/gamma-HCH transport system substrate-binding protein|nr:MlaD family protein [Candidatus Sulfotelmatobacter sp.]
MTPRTEQTLVGLFVLIAGGILLVSVFAINGAFGSSAKTYHAHFQFAGGLEPGATVRYSGGPKVGRVDGLRIDPQDASRIDLTFSVQPDVVVKTDSKVKIMSLSPLGDNHLELYPGSAHAGVAQPGALLVSDTYIDFNALTEQINNLAPHAQQLVDTLNTRATELKVTLDRVNDLLNAQNRSNLSATLAETRGLIADSRPQVKTALQNVNDLSRKVGPLIDDFRKTSGQANELLGHVDAAIGEDQPEIRKTITELRGTLRSLNDLTGQLNQTLDVNSENIDQLLDNLLHVTENLKEFTETIKTRPYSLIRATNPPEHRTGE